MLRKRFSTALLALLVAAAIPGSAFAEEVESEATTQINAPITLSEPAIGSEEGQTPEIPTTELITEAPAPADTVAPATEIQAPPAEEQPAAEVPPTVEAPAAPIVEPEVVAPIEAELAAPIVEPEVIAPIEEAVVTEPAILVPEVVTEPAIVVPEVVTEPAIVVEPVAATLTITHRLIVGDKHSDITQTIEGLTVGQVIDLTPYLTAEDWEESLSRVTNVTLENTENIIVLEYAVKADSGVIVVIEDDVEDAGGEKE